MFPVSQNFKACLAAIKNGPDVTVGISSFRLKTYPEFQTSEIQATKDGRVSVFKKVVF